jgi:hypothetical protein
LSKIDSKLGKIHQFRISVKNLYPPIWRRLLVNEFTTLADFHYILQIIMSWSDTHLHCFNIRGKEFGTYHDGGLAFDDDPKKILLADFNFYVSERFTYEYNFSDDWELEIRLEKSLPQNKKQIYPTCIAGERAGPLEDCGGHEEFTELLAQYNPLEIDRHLSEMQKELKKVQLN